MTDENDILLKDLEIQWQDHFHMRDQTWKTLTNTLYLFVGVIGLKFTVKDALVLKVAYIALAITAFFGFLVSCHHRRRQRQKFKMITHYEEKLGLYEMKENTLKKDNDVVNTASFIVVMELLIFLVSIFMLFGA